MPYPKNWREYLSKQKKGHKADGCVASPKEVLRQRRLFERPKIVFDPDSMKTESIADQLVVTHAAATSGSPLIDTFLGVPRDNTGSSIPISTWDLRHVRALLAVRKQLEDYPAESQAKKTLVVRSAPREPPIGEPPPLSPPVDSPLASPLVLNRELFEGAFPHLASMDPQRHASLREMRRSLSRLVKSQAPPEPVKATLPCGHEPADEPGVRVGDDTLVSQPMYMQVTATAMSKAEGSRARQTAFRMSDVKHRGQAEVAMYSLIHKGFAGCVLMGAVNGSLYLLDGNLGRSLSGTASDQAGTIWCISGMGSGALTVEREAHLKPLANSQAMCTISNRLYFICGEAHGMEGDGALWEYNTSSKELRCVRPPGSFVDGVLMAAIGETIYVVCGVMGGCKGCGGLFAVNVEEPSGQTRVRMDSGSCSNAQAMATMNGKLYVIFGSVFGLRGRGCIMEYNVKEGVRRVILSSGFTDGVLMTAMEQKLYVVCCAMGGAGTVGCLWEVDVRRDKSKSKRIDIRRELLNAQGLAAMRGKLYIVCGSAFGLHGTGELWETSLTALDSTTRRHDGKLCFSFEEYCLMREIFGKVGSDHASVEQMRSVLEEVQERLHLHVDPVLWKQIECDRIRYPALDFTCMLRILFSKRPITDIKQARNTHEAERRRRETEEMERQKQLDWRNRFTPSQVKDLEDLFEFYIRDHPGDDKIVLKDLLLRLPNHAVITHADVDEVFRSADTDADGALSLHELAWMLDEVFVKERESIVHPDLYYQDDTAMVGQAARIERRLDALLEGTESATHAAAPHVRGIRLARAGEATSVRLPEYAPRCKQCGAEGSSKGKEKGGVV